MFMASTSWEQAEKWYNECVGDQGHYYHQHIVIPGVIRLLNLSESASLLDLACGQGILGRHIPENNVYAGIDISPSLIKDASNGDRHPRHRYLVGDAAKRLPIEKKNFTHAALVLAVQNIRDPHYVFENAAKHLVKEGVFVIAMNHPCFRIPRQSSWKIDEKQKIQYRRIDRYASPMDIPIRTHPSKGSRSAETWSFHRPLADYCRWLKQAGFVIDVLDEWYSDKVSKGKAAKMENRSREEFPLFLAIKAIKPPIVP